MRDKLRTNNKWMIRQIIMNLQAVLDNDSPELEDDRYNTQLKDMEVISTSVWSGLVDK